MISPRYDLVFSYHCSGYTTLDGSDTGVFLQGEDYESLEVELAALWAKVRNHRKPMPG